MSRIRQLPHTVSGTHSDWSEVEAVAAAVRVAIVVASLYWVLLIASRVTTTWSPHHHDATRIRVIFVIVVLVFPLLLSPSPSSASWSPPFLARALLLPSHASLPSFPSTPRASNVVVPASNGGVCDVMTQSLPCTPSPTSCLGNCTLSPWSGWSLCSGACGRGVMVRTRTVLSPGVTQTTVPRACAAYPVYDVASCSSAVVPAGTPVCAVNTPSSGVVAEGAAVDIAYRFTYVCASPVAVNIALCTASTVLAVNTSVVGADSGHSVTVLVAAVLTPGVDVSGVWPIVASASSGAYLPDVNITVVDRDRSTVQPSVSSVVMLQGTTMTYTVVLTSLAQQAVRVAIASPDCAGVTANPSLVVFNSGNWAVPVLITAAVAVDAMSYVRRSCRTCRSGYGLVHVGFYWAVWVVIALAERCLDAYGGHGRALAWSPDVLEGVA